MGFVKALVGIGLVLLPLGRWAHTSIKNGSMLNSMSYRRNKLFYSDQRAKLILLRDEKKLFAAKLKTIITHGEREWWRIKQRQRIAEAERIVKDQEKLPPSPFEPNAEASVRRYWNVIGLNPKEWLEEARHIEPYPVKSPIPEPELEINMEYYEELKRIWQIEDDIRTAWKKQQKTEEEQEKEEKVYTGFLSEMSIEEAMSILQLTPEEAKDKNKVRNAYKRLMFANHPDKGGSRYIALKLSEAKDFILKRIDSELPGQSPSSSTSTSASTNTSENKNK
jgi:hypothetical protein